MRRVHILATAAQNNGDIQKTAQEMREFENAQDYAASSVVSGPAVIVQSVDGNDGGKHRKSIAESISGSQGGQISHSGTVLSRTITEKMSMLENEDQIDKEAII